MLDHRQFIYIQEDQPFIRNFINFFTPQEGQFITMIWNMENLKYVKIGFKFFALLLGSDVWYKILEAKETKSIFVV